MKTKQEMEGKLRLVFREEFKEILKVYFYLKNFTAVLSFILESVFKNIDQKTSCINAKKFQSICTFDNGILTETQTAINPSERSSKIVRWINDEGQLITSMECEEVEARRIYKRVS